MSSRPWRRGGDGNIPSPCTSRSSESSDAPVSNDAASWDGKAHSKRGADILKK